MRIRDWKAIDVCFSPGIRKLIRDQGLERIIKVAIDFDTENFILAKESRKIMIYGTREMIECDRFDKLMNSVSHAIQQLSSNG